MNRKGRYGQRNRKFNKKKQKSNFPWMIILLAVLILAAVIVLGVIIGGSGGKKGFEGKGFGDIFNGDEKEEKKIELDDPIYPHSSQFDYEVGDVEGGEPEFINPLTGLEAQRDLSGVRPCAIMINNIKASLPQEGISNADILYECLAEGGITRLLMVACDYESLGVVGSIRSSREYYIDFAKNHDAIYIHAGGSEEAYAQIESRGIDHLDGVNADPITGKNMGSTVFYRDPDRMAKMSLEHTMVSTGELIAKGVEIMGYRTEIQTGFKDPVRPINWGWDVVLSGDKATNVKVPYRSEHIAEFEYDKTSGRYLRYQGNHDKHIDNTNQKQLEFDNIVILNLDHANRGDSYNHLDITTWGEGDGYYITRGKVIEIEWSKDSADSPLALTDSEGCDLVMNRGKTMINIADDKVYSQITFN